MLSELLYNAYNELSDNFLHLVLFYVCKIAAEFSLLDIKCVCYLNKQNSFMRGKSHEGVLFCLFSVF